MTKFLLGVAVGYMLSDIIDDFLGKNAPEKPQAPSSQPSPPTEPVVPPHPDAGQT